MQKSRYLKAISIFILVITAFAGKSAADLIDGKVVTVRLNHQYRSVRPASRSGLAVEFQLEKGWYFYADAETAPGGMGLKVKPSSQNYISFFEPVFPHTDLYHDKLSGRDIEIFGGNFTVYLPFETKQIKLKQGDSITAEVTVRIEGALCSATQCRMPDFATLTTKIKITPDAAMQDAGFELPQDLSEKPVFDNYNEKPKDLNQTISSVRAAFLIALLAGLSLNIMPCLWPVLPLIVMRIVEQAGKSKRKSILMGFAFCGGILLFFGCLAGANVVLQVFYGTVLQWGDQFRSPAFLTIMAGLLVFLALFMFGVFTINFPSFKVSTSGSRGKYSGSVAMGFLAAVLSTPCSFGILAAAFAWAQAQKMILGTAAIMAIGLGMAVPYMILTAMPGLLAKLPRAGRWMDLFKQTVGFLLLLIAVKLIAALPEEQTAGVLYFTVVLAFSLWMWGGWVNFNTGFRRKVTIRLAAVVLVFAGGWIFLAGPADNKIDWQKYDERIIEHAVSNSRPVLINFTADWCLSCQVVEKMVYAEENIVKLIEQKNILAVKGDTTGRADAATLALKNKYNEPGVPVSILLMPGNKEPVRWRAIFFADELKEYLHRLPDK